MTTLPSGALRKLNRADHHLRELREVVGSYLDSKPFKFTRTFEFVSRKSTVRHEAVHEMPQSIPLVFGDLVHNLRAVLDHIYFDTLSEHHGKIREIQFPTYDDISKASTLGRKVHKEAPDKIKAAIASINPSPGGEHAIWELHELDIIDKHRVMLISANIADLTISQFLSAAPEFREVIKGWGYVRFGNHSAFATDAPPEHPFCRRFSFHEDIDIRARYELVLSGKVPFADQGIIAVADKLRSGTERAALLLCEARE